MKKLVLTLCAFVLVGLLGCSDQNTSSSFSITALQPLNFEFGRGSGWHGLDTIKIDETGHVVLHRMKVIHGQGAWEQASLDLSQEDFAQIFEAMESNHLMGLDNHYHKDIHDGTQWVLWIKHGEQEKSVYFNNHFPFQITHFAEQLDAILLRAGIEEVDWFPVEAEKSREHEKQLWDSIKPRDAGQTSSAA